MQRILFALYYGVRHFRCLQSKPKISSVLDLSAHTLRQHHVEILVLDFDGVLASHGEAQIKPACQAWLKAFIQTWPQKNIVILSNKPFPERIEAVQSQFPEIVFISGMKKKPYPEGLQHIARLKNVPPQAMLLVDDRILTGMLACCLSGAQGLLIKKPFSNYRKRPLKEIFFSTLRVLEKMIY